MHRPLKPVMKLRSTDYAYEVNQTRHLLMEEKFHQEQVLTIVRTKNSQKENKGDHKEEIHEKNRLIQKYSNVSWTAGIPK